MSLWILLWVSLSGASLSVWAQSSAIEELTRQLEQEEGEEERRLTLVLKLAEKFRIYSIDSVQKYAELAEQLASQEADSISLSIAWRQLAWARGLMQQNIAQLIQDADKAQKLAARQGDSLNMHWARIELARGYMVIQKIEEAKTFAIDALTYSQRHALPIMESEAYNTYAYIYFLSDLKTSLSYRYKALQAAEEAKDTVRMAFQTTQVASILKFMKSDSVAYFLGKAKSLFQARPSPVYEGVLYFNQAEYYGDLGYGDSLLVFALKADELGSQSNYVQVSRVAKALLFAYYFIRQDYEAAAPVAREVLAIEKKRPSVNYVSAFVDMARVEAALGRADSAESYFQSAIEALKILKSPRFEILVRGYYGEFLNEQGRHAEALTQLEKGKILSDQGGEAALQDFLLLQLGNAAYSNREFAKSKNTTRRP